MRDAEEHIRCWLGAMGSRILGQQNSRWSGGTTEDSLMIEGPMSNADVDGHDDLIVWPWLHRIVDVQNHVHASTQMKGQIRVQVRLQVRVHVRVHVQAMVMRSLCVKMTAATSARWRCTLQSLRYGDVPCIVSAMMSVQPSASRSCPLQSLRRVCVETASSLRRVCVESA